MIAMKEVKSTALQAWGYDPASRVFAVRFNATRVSNWSDVPQTVADGFEAAESKGRALSMLRGFDHVALPVDAPAEEVAS